MSEGPHDPKQEDTEPIPGIHSNLREFLNSTPEVPQSTSPFAAALGGHRRFERNFMMAIAAICGFLVGGVVFLCLWGRLHYVVPGWVNWVFLAIAVVPGFLVWLFVHRLLERRERQTPSPTQEAAPCDENNRHVSHGVVGRIKYLLAEDTEFPENNETHVVLIQREHWEVLPRIVWIQALAFLGITALFVLVNTKTELTVVWWLWLVPLAAAAWGYIRGMTLWYYTVYFLTEFRLVRAMVPPLPFQHDVDFIMLSSLTNARQERRKLATFLDSVAIKLEGIGDSNPSEDNRWDRLPFITRAEKFIDELRKHSNRQHPAM